MYDHETAMLAISVKEAIRDKYAWPGGYALRLLMSDGELMCLDCAHSNFREIVKAMRDGLPRDDWRPASVEIYWEGPSLSCCHCGVDIVSEYGDPEEESE